MGQIVSAAAKPKRCNMNQLSQVPTPAAGEYILVSYDNSMTANGQGNFDRYIIGDGRTAAAALELKYLDDSTRPYIVEEVNKAVADIQPIEITGDVTNAPDEEDLTSENQGGTDVLKFKDKAYNSALYSGLGRVYLRKNIVTLEGTGKNVLTQAMVNTANTIYHIQYDYDLNGQTITLPAGCVLEFDGGSIVNGEIRGDVIIEGTPNDASIFTGCYILSPRSNRVTSAQIGLIPNNASFALHNSQKLVRAINLGYEIVFTDVYYLSSCQETITNDVVMSGGTLILQAGHNLIISNSNKVVLDGITIKQNGNNGFCNLLFVPSEEYLYFDEVTITNCTLVSCRPFTYVGTDVDQVSTIQGIKAYTFCFNKIINANAYVVRQGDLLIQTARISNNYAHNITAVGLFSFGRTNEYTQYADYTLQKAYVENNIVINDTPVDDNNDIYFTAFLIEAKEVYFRGNYIRGISRYYTGSDAVVSKPVYSFYLSADIGVVENNTLFNNLDLNDNHYNSLFKFKQGGGTKIIRGNVCRITEDYLTKYGVNKTDVSVQITEIQQYFVDTIVIDNNEINVDCGINLGYQYCNFNYFSMCGNVIHGYNLAGSYLFDGRVTTGYFKFCDNTITADVIDKTYSLFYNTKSFKTLIKNNNMCISLQGSDYYRQSTKDTEIADNTIHLTSEDNNIYLVGNIRNTSIVKSIKAGVNAINIPQLDNVATIKDFEVKELFNVINVTFKGNNDLLRVYYITYKGITHRFILYKDTTSNTFVGYCDNNILMDKTLDSYRFTLSPATGNLTLFGLAYTQDVERSLHIRLETYTDNIDTIIAKKLAEYDDYNAVKIGDTNSRPTAVSRGFEYFDKTIDKLVYWNGSVWSDQESIYYDYLLVNKTIIQSANINNDNTKATILVDRTKVNNPFSWGGSSSFADKDKYSLIPIPNGARKASLFITNSGFRIYAAIRTANGTFVWESGYKNANVTINVDVVAKNASGCYLILMVQHQTASDEFTDETLTDLGFSINWEFAPATSGTFANKPTGVNVGFQYFCTDKQTTEGATNGIEITYKGNDVWVDALGRVIS